MAFEPAVAMDVDNTPTSSRSKYHGGQPPPPSYHPPSVSKPYNDSRKAVSDQQPPPQSRTTPSGSRDRRPRSSGGGYQQQPAGTITSAAPRPGGVGVAGPPLPTSNPPIGAVTATATPQLQGHFANPSPPPPQSTTTTHLPVVSGYAKDSSLVSSATPPPDTSAQPTFPPPAVTADSPQPSEVSQRRPAYLLHRDLVIGKGSYGQVCIASRGEPEGHSSGRSGKRKKFACKCVLLRSDPKYIAKLQEEVNVLRELRGHQNVIRLYDVFCVDNELFIITELGRGGDLFHLLTTHPKHGVTEAYAGTYHTTNRRVGRPRMENRSSISHTLHFLFRPLITTAKTVSEMLSSVAFLHSRSICHRDLKLENWVLESGKDVWSPLKLIDFGLSTHFSPGQRLSRVVGSSYYVAPEVLKKSYTEACDLWSLGVIVYMLLSGAPPFYGKNDEAIKASIVQGEYTFPHELFRDVSDEAMAFVSTLLSYNIEYRYTAEQALTHPWLAANCDPEALQRCKDGARGIGLQVENSSTRLDPMQL